MSSEIALDLRRYDTPAKLGSLINDTASLSIEASENEGSPRINPHFFIKRGPDYVIAPGRDNRDVREMFEAGGLGTKAGLESRKYLLKEKEVTYVWVSAPDPLHHPDPWLEARIQVGTKKLTRSQKFEYLKMYDISTPSLAKESCLKLGQFLVSISLDKLAYPENVDDLRNLAIRIEVPAGKDPFEYLSTLIELPEKIVWESLLNGQADKNKLKAIRAAGKATEKVRNLPQLIYQSPILAGEEIEVKMRQYGFGMNPARFGCGMSNTTFTNAFFYTESLTSKIGAEDLYGSLEFKCPHCHAINRRPHGYLISNCQHCGGDVSC